MNQKFLLKNNVYGFYKSETEFTWEIVESFKFDSEFQALSKIEMLQIPGYFTTEHVYFTQEPTIIEPVPNTKQL
jgi:hypothetical protein